MFRIAFRSIFSMGICLHQADGKYIIAFEGRELKKLPLAVYFKAVSHVRVTRKQFLHVSLKDMNCCGENKPFS